MSADRFLGESYICQTYHHMTDIHRHQHPQADSVQSQSRDVPEKCLSFDHFENEITVTRLINACCCHELQLGPLNVEH